MGIRLISIKCPECGAALDVEEGRKQIFCTYCGAKVLLHNENEFVFRSIDEAEVKHAETEQMIELKRLEMIEQRHKEKAKNRSKRLKTLAVVETIAFILIAGGFGMGNLSNNPDSAFYMLSMLGLLLAVTAPLALMISGDKEEEEDITLLGKVKVPSSISEFEKKDYTAIEAMFKNAGFTNVRCIALNDLRVGLLKKSGTVESITINGSQIYSGGKAYSKDASVVISYHSYS